MLFGLFKAADESQDDFYGDDESQDDFYGDDDDKSDDDFMNSWRSLFGLVDEQGELRSDDDDDSEDDSTDETGTQPSWLGWLGL